MDKHFKRADYASWRYKTTHNRRISTSGRAVQANLTSKFSQKKNDSTLLNFWDYEQKPNRKMKWLLLVFFEIVVWFLPIFCVGLRIFCMAISFWSAVAPDLQELRRNVDVVQKRQGPNLDHPSFNPVLSPVLS